MTGSQNKIGRQISEPIGPGPKANSKTAYRSPFARGEPNPPATAESPETDAFLLSSDSLKQDGIPVKIEEGPLSARKPSDVHDINGVYAHPLQGWTMGHG